MNNKMRVVFGLLGKLVMVFSLGMLVPFIYGICIGEWIWPLLGSALLTVTVGAALDRAGKTSYSISLSQGFVIVSFTWILASLLGALPYYFWGQLPSFVDALFEAVSGFTATGATVMLDVDSVPRALLLYRSMTHWFGGLGIVVLMLAFLRSLGPESMTVFYAEASINGYDRILPRIKSYAIRLWIIYTVFSVVLVGMLWLAGMDLFSAVNYSMSIIATGGFAPTGSGAFAYAENMPVLLVMTLFMVISGGNYGLYYIGWKKGWRAIARDREMQVYLSIMLGGFLALAAILYTNGTEDAPTSILHGLFMMVSIQTGSGFALADYDLWPSVAQFILYIAMFIGGTSGSTTGSVKVIRYIFIFKAVWSYLQQLVHPGMVKVIKYNGKAISNKQVQAALIFFILYILIYFLSAMLAVLTGMSWWEAMTGVAGTLGNVGLAFGELGPTDSFALIHPVAKLVFTADMLLGRLELFTLLVMLHPGFWRSFLRKDRTKDTRDTFL